MKPSGIVFNWDGPQAAALPELGKIKVGIKVDGPRGEIPKSIDYFRATGKYGEIVHSAFGDKPVRLPVIFVNPDPSHSCNERLEIRKGGKVYAYGDGRVFNIWSTKLRKFVVKKVDSKQAYEALLAEVSGECKAEWYRALTLRFMMPLPGLPKGEWSFHTKASATSIKNIRGAFDGIPDDQFQKAHLENLPDMAGAVCILEVKMHTADNLSGSKYPIVSLLPMIVRPGIEAPLVEAMNLNPGVGPFSLPEGVDRPHEEELPVIQVHTKEETIEPVSRASEGPLTLKEARGKIEEAVRKKNLSGMEAVWDSSAHLHTFEVFKEYALAELQKLWQLVRTGNQPPGDWNDQVKRFKTQIIFDHETSQEDGEK